MTPLRIHRLPTAIAAIALLTTLSVDPSSAFAPGANNKSPIQSLPTRSQTANTIFTTSTSLNALGVFVRKAKEADVRKYCQDGPPESVLSLLQKIKDSSDKDDEVELPTELQTLLTKRKGTITIIAEYKRKLEGSGFITDVLDPVLLSPVFREFGAAAVAVLADERTGGCTYDDIVAVVEEQDEALGDVPGPLPVISSDLIVDEIQIAQAADSGAKAVTVTYGVVGEEKVQQFIKDAASLGLEVIVNVGTAEEAQGAVNAGASIISVTGVDGSDNKFAVIESLSIPEGRNVCTIANILAKDNKALEEVEEAWMCRDAGFNCVWVSDALYKAGNDPVEHPGAIISTMKAKSSVKYASPKARSGKGEGAREYLGDILM
ncbi:indole-3-glycerol phosphate synthase [Skeletonema marinoi]|uniref:indole-3-glycerol-phosphate synthase n=1 Tax=Skeletonema marinoi TaxID=267567 RepID=A0AAD9DCT8_9STRA|nr:indole-3-glycerol phosphate synthase [Skeletonema marinoi]